MSLSDKRLKEIIRESKEFAGCSDTVPTKDDLKRVGKEARVAEVIAKGIFEAPWFKEKFLTPI